MAARPLLSLCSQLCAATCVGIAALLPSPLSAVCYEVEFAGLRDASCVAAMRSVSDLVHMQDRPPASFNGLRYRVEADLPALLKVLRAYAYYDATLTYDIEPVEEGARVTLFIHAGPQYSLGSYQVFRGACEEPAQILGCHPLSPEQLGLRPSQPAVSVDIVNAELQLLTELSRCGYPLAYIDKRRVEVDMQAKEVNAAVCVQEGPYAKFGPISLFGLRNIHPRYIERRITWKEGEAYDSDRVAETQNRILKTELFSSAYISHGEELDAIGELPMKIRLTEAKHRLLSLGVYYATVDGPGASFGWTHRNVRGMGEILSLEGDVSFRYIGGEIAYKKPDFLSVDQSYRALAAVSREDIHPFTAFNYRFANYIERKIDPKRTFSAGLKIEHIDVSRSATNGTYLLAGLPLFFKYDTSNDPLDPTRGYTLVYQLTPYQSLFHGAQHFVKQRLTGTFYIPVALSNKFVLALRAQFGSIAGTRRRNVPLPKLFLGGSEDDLRGYRYLTVSPLNDDRKPLGGRSAVFTTVETRIRVNKKIGLVSFADFGTVAESELPDFDTKWFKSVGVGLRYYAYFGPLRFDVGIPLDRRKGIDARARFYASVGQTF